MLPNNQGLLTPVIYYEENYKCKISISCQCTIALVFFILALIGVVGSLSSLNVFSIFSSLISAAIYFLLYKNLKSVKDKYQKNIHPCTEKGIIQILSGIITVFNGLAIFVIFITALAISSIDLEDYSSNSLSSGSLEDLQNLVRIVLFVILAIYCIPFVFMLLIFINSFHIN